MKNFILLIILSLSIGVSGQCEKDRVLYDSLTFDRYYSASYKSDRFTGVAYKLNEKENISSEINFSREFYKIFYEDLINKTLTFVLILF